MKSLKTLIGGGIVAFALANPAMAGKEELKLAATDALAAVYDLTLFESVKVRVGLNRVHVTATGNDIEVRHVYAKKNGELGQLLEVEEAVDTDNLADVIALLPAEIVAKLAGYNATDMSFDRSCKKGRCDESFDASGEGFDISYDEDCDRNGCERSYDMSGVGFDDSWTKVCTSSGCVREMESGSDTSRELTDVEWDAIDAAEDEADRLADARDDAADAAEAEADDEDS